MVLIQNLTVRLTVPATLKATTVPVRSIRPSQNLQFVEMSRWRSSNHSGHITVRQGYCSYRLSYRSHHYNGDVTSRIVKIVRPLRVQLNLEMFDGSDLVSIASFLSAFQVTPDTNIFHQNAAIWLFISLRDPSQSLLDARNVWAVWAECIKRFNYHHAVKSKLPIGNVFNPQFYRQTHHEHYERRAASQSERSGTFACLLCKSSTPWATLRPEWSQRTMYWRKRTVDTTNSSHPLS